MKTLGLRVTATVMLLLVGAALATGCGGGVSAGSRVTATAAARHDRFTYARALFTQICAGCHTLADAEAHGWRLNLDHDDLLSRALVSRAIRYGEHGMPAWEGVLSRREVNALVAYVDAVAKRLPGESGWSRQARVHMEGER